jgi:broad specificity phosphatase PhoE
MILLLVRHGESTKNISDSFGGRNCDFEITTAGIEQIRRTSDWIRHLMNRKHLGYGVILSSPERRAERSAAILSSLPHFRLVFDERLSSIDSGSLSGMTEIAARKAFPEVMYAKDRYRLGILNGYNVTYPNGESVVEFQQRVVSALADILHEVKSPLVVFVGHQSTITAVLSWMTPQKKSSRWYHYFVLDCGGISEVHYGSKGNRCIISVNVRFSEGTDDDSDGN